jgi:hypothetical protein
MGISLKPFAKEDEWFQVNFWNWRPIVELIRSVDVLSNERVDQLHEPYCGYGLNEDEVIAVADALEAKVLPRLSSEERVLIDGSTTIEPDDGIFHKEEPARNYSTTKPVLLEFIKFCRECKGFTVL